MKRSAPRLSLGLIAALGVVSCAAPRASQPPALRSAQVRLDIHARALQEARAVHDTRCPPASCDRSAPSALALQRALETAGTLLLEAETAAARWAHGDGRPFHRLHPQLTAALERVQEVLQSRGYPIPPGLALSAAPSLPAGRR